jgi:mannitol-1-/sugar-/sorbitol-6-phosphatase
MRGPAVPFVPMRRKSELLLTCRAVLFDLDGVLIDTTQIINEVWTKWAEDNGLEPRKVLETAHGRRTLEVIAAVAPHLTAETEAQLLEDRETQRSHTIASIEGAADLIAALPPGSWAVVTSAGRALALHRMSIAGLPTPETLVSAEDVDEGKPHPEGYLAAASKLGVRPEDCVVIEDAPAGIQAARAAGMRVVALPTTFAPDVLADADAVVSSLAELKVDAVEQDGDGRARIELVIGR